MSDVWKRAIVSEDGDIVGLQLFASLFNLHDDGKRRRRIDLLLESIVSMIGCLAGYWWLCVLVGAHSDWGRSRIFDRCARLVPSLPHTEYVLRVRWRNGQFLGRPCFFAFFRIIASIRNA